MMPAFLKDNYKIELPSDRVLGRQRMVRGDMEFIDSSKWADVQIIDLIVLELRRCLRRGFQDNETVALLARLMVQPSRWRGAN